jgi:cobaltochelatase CobN
MEAFLLDDAVRAFLAEVNPAALKDMAARLLEAQDRGLWRGRRNDTRSILSALAAGLAPPSTEDDTP